jgi:hypothetical protein
MGKLCGQVRSLVSVEFGRRSISVKIIFGTGLRPTSKETQAGKAYRNSGGGVTGFESERGLRGHSVSTEACDFTSASKKFGQTGGEAEVTIDWDAMSWVELQVFLINALAGYLSLTDSDLRRGLTSLRSS